MVAPKDWLEPDQGVFGNFGHPLWRAANGLFEEAELLAAQTQFAISRRVRRIQKDRKVAAEELSEKLHKSRNHVGRKLRGELWIDIRDLAEWATVLEAPELLGELGSSS